MSDIEQRLSLVSILNQISYKNNKRFLTYVKIYLIISIRLFLKLQRNRAEILNIVEMVNVSK